MNGFFLMSVHGGASFCEVSEVDEWIRPSGVGVNGILTALFGKTPDGAYLEAVSLKGRSWGCNVFRMMLRLGNNATFCLSMADRRDPVRDFIN
jgi:hypothetical protein